MIFLKVALQTIYESLLAEPSFSLFVFRINSSDTADYMNIFILPHFLYIGCGVLESQNHAIVRHFGMLCPVYL